MRMYVESFSSTLGPMCSWEMLNFVYHTSFQKKNDTGRPQQPLTEKVSDISENRIFDDPFHKKRLVLGIWVLEVIKPSGSVNLLTKRGCQGHWSYWGHWGHWGCRGFRVWNITTGDFRVIQAFEFSFIFIFWKENFLGKTLKYHIEL